MAIHQRTTPAVVLLTALLGLGACALALAQARAPPEIRLLTLDGVINPLSARYFERELDDAVAAGAHAVVLRLNTTGGELTSMRRRDRSRRTR